MTSEKIFRFIFVTGILLWAISLICVAATVDFHKYSNVTVCESDRIQTCKTYKNVEVLDSTINNIVIKDHQNTFTLKGRIFKYE